MRTIETTGGPLMGIDRQSLSRWGGVFHSSFFAENSSFANDYEEMCGQLEGRRSTNLSTLKGTHAEAILIDLPLPTFIVEANGTSVHLIQVWSSEQGWSKSRITMIDFQNADNWGDGVSFFCGGGEFVIFDSSCSHEEIEDHFSIYLERGEYKCESCQQKRKGQANIVLIRMLKQA